MVVYGCLYLTTPPFRAQFVTGYDRITLAAKRADHMADHTKANGKRGLGRLFKKAGGKQYPADATTPGTYYLTYYVNGQRKTEQLCGQNGEPITDRKEAETARRIVVAPFLAGDELEAQRQVLARVSCIRGGAGVCRTQPSTIPEGHPALTSHPGGGSQVRAGCC